MNDGVFIKKIKGETWDKFIDENVAYLDDILTYGQYLVGINNEKKYNEKYQSTIILLFCELLETVDGIKSLIAGNSFGVCKILLRQLIEITSYLTYILSDKNLIKERSLAYQINQSKDSIKSYRVLRNKSVDNIEKTHWDGAIKNLENMFKKSDYSQIVKQWNKNNQLPWFGISNGNKNLRDLLKDLNLEPVYDLYRALCPKSHGADAMSSINVDKNGNILLMNPKHPYDIESILTGIAICAQFTFVKFITNYLEAEDMVNYIQWETNNEKEKNRLIEQWGHFKDIYIYELHIK